MEEEKASTVYRKFDSDDVVRLRSGTIRTEVVSGKEKMSVDAGMLQKYSIVLGIKSCEWFKDRIDDKFGVTDEIFARRATEEFRRIPVTEIDKLFKEVQDYNKADYNVNELRKNSNTP